MSEYFMESAREQVKNSTIFEYWLNYENQFDSEYLKLNKNFPQVKAFDWLIRNHKRSQKCNFSSTINPIAPPGIKIYLKKYKIEFPW